jgi:glycerophosphoryl diester phosphodiesterase
MLPRSLKFSKIFFCYFLSMAWVQFEVIQGYGQGILFQDRPFDIQGHRGFRGRWPENTWVGMKAALEAGVTTLEMDVVMSRDGQVLLSHEPWMNPEICDGPGVIREPRFAPLNLYQMDYAQIRTYHCGSPHGHPRFVQQQSVESPKPLLSEILDSVRAYCQRNVREYPSFNIEIKSKPAWDGVYHPRVGDFVRAVVEVVALSGFKENCMVQSFDERVPGLVLQVDSALKRACLVEYTRVWSRTRLAGRTMDTWGEKAEVYSPHFRMVTKGTIKQMHKRGVKVIPWTVNNPMIMRRLIRWGVDGIITDYPDILVDLRQTRAGQTP